ncbi:MAG: hypothetical protein C5B47_02680 [Verrucomicrobia bacterium]|nr:MAG: hypothetical protein C5B47_02680 [Verrucomicrobiota bacterium]
MIINIHRKLTSIGFRRGCFHVNVVSLKPQTRVRYFVSRKKNQFEMPNALLSLEVLKRSLFPKIGNIR